ncbi:MAG: type II toxin-antitoxin system VapC family toxin [Kiritimatiellia bacterium]
MRAILDSDVLIDYLQGIARARAEIDLYARREISIISWMEVLSGAQDEEEKNAARRFLDSFTVQPLTVEVASEAVALRRQHRIRLPDAIIWATARIHGCLLVTRNTKDFPARDPGVRFPYVVKGGG